MTDIAMVVVECVAMFASIFSTIYFNADFKNIKDGLNIKLSAIYACCIGISAGNTK